MNPMLLVVVAVFAAAVSADPIALIPSNWNVLYDGYGQVTWSANETVSFEPQTNDAGTSAVLILSVGKARDFSLSVVATTTHQLKSSPNPWEVFWVMFNYQQIGGATSTNKTTNYFILKPEVGCELGTAYDSVGQTFIATSSTYNLTLGVAYHYAISKQGQHLTVAINGTTVFDATYAQLYDQEGFIGLYCEDSAVQVASVDLTTQSNAAPSLSSSSWMMRLLSALPVVHLG